MNPRSTSVPAKRSGFTLIEIALTLGIIAFALVAIIGLIPVALQADRAAADDTALAAAANRVASDLYGRGFAYLSATSTAKPWPYYFDSEGIPMPAATGALYECVIVQAGTANPPALAPSAVSPNLMDFEVRFAWPVDAPANKRDTRSIPITMGKYD